MTLEAGIETRPTLRYTITAQPTSELRHLGNYKALSVSFHLFTNIPYRDTKVLNSFEELCIMQVAAVNSFPRMLNPVFVIGLN